MIYDLAIYDCGACKKAKKWASRSIPIVNR